MVLYGHNVLVWVPNVKTLAVRWHPKTVANSTVETWAIYCIVWEVATTKDIQGPNMIQRNTTVTSCSGQFDGDDPSVPAWHATGTIERYDVELQWKASKNAADLSWKIEICAPIYDENATVPVSDDMDLVLSGEPPWRTDVAYVLRAFPPK